MKYIIAVIAAFLCLATMSLAVEVDSSMNLVSFTASMGSASVATATAPSEDKPTGFKALTAKVKKAKAALITKSKQAANATKSTISKLKSKYRAVKAAAAKKVKDVVAGTSLGKSVTKAKKDLAKTREMPDGVFAEVSPGSAASGKPKKESEREKHHNANNTSANKTQSAPANFNGYSNSTSSANRTSQVSFTLLQTGPSKVPQLKSSLKKTTNPNKPFPKVTFSDDLSTTRAGNTTTTTTNGTPSPAGASSSSAAASSSSANNGDDNDA